MDAEELKEAIILRKALAAAYGTASAFNFLTPESNLEAANEQIKAAKETGELLTRQLAEACKLAIIHTA
jgi:hypothetical protein